MKLRFLNDEGRFYLANDLGERLRLPDPDEIRTEPVSPHLTHVELRFSDRTSISLTVQGSTGKSSQRHPRRAPVPGQYLG